MSDWTMARKEREHKLFIVTGREIDRMEGYCGQSMDYEKEIPPGAKVITKAEIRTFQGYILHGDDEHKKWLIESFDEWINQLFGEEKP